MAEEGVDVGAEGGAALDPSFLPPATPPPATPPPVPAAVVAAAVGGMPGMDPLSRVGTPSRERKELWELLNLPEVCPLAARTRVYYGADPLTLEPRATGAGIFWRLAQAAGGHTIDENDQKCNEPGKGTRGRPPRHAADLLGVHRREHILCLHSEKNVHCARTAARRDPTVARRDGKLAGTV